MLDVTLTVYSGDESREVPMLSSSLSLGRGEAANLPISDEGLSKIHATVHCEDDRVWILDEASTNGTSVNGARVPPTGTPLKNGDEITLGARTAIRVSIRQRKTAVVQAPVSTVEKSDSALGIKIAAFVAGIAVVFLAALGIYSFASRNSAGDAGDDEPRYTSRTAGNQPDSTSGSSNSNSIIRPTTDTSPAVTTTSPKSTEGTAGLPTDPITTTSTDVQGAAGAPKTYAAMAPAERSAFVASEAQHIARRIGNREGNQFTQEALARIRNNVDAYASRARAGPSPGCHFGQGLQTTLERASKSAPFINRAFNEKGLSPVIGLYLAMIESEYCVCLTSPTGPMGMFQFTRATARAYGLQVLDPEERCIPEKAAPAAAGYMKALLGRYGTGPLSVPLAIASYNSGEGGLSGNLDKALSAVRNSENPERSFWTLVANADMLSDQFQKENIKYVPKFFAGAIIGENPKVFGVNLEPLSTYTAEQPKP